MSLRPLVVTHRTVFSVVISVLLFSLIVVFIVCLLCCCYSVTSVRYSVAAELWSQENI